MTTWHNFKTRQCDILWVAIKGNKRYTVTRIGLLIVTMKYSDVVTYESRFISAPNARSYAEELMEMEN